MELPGLHADIIARGADGEVVRLDSLDDAGDYLNRKMAQGVPVLYTWFYDATTWAAAFVPFSVIPPGISLRAPTKIGVAEGSGERMGIWVSMDGDE